MNCFSRSGELANFVGYKIAQYKYQHGGTEVLYFLCASVWIDITKA